MGVDSVVGLRGLTNRLFAHPRPSSLLMPLRHVPRRFAPSVHDALRPFGGGGLQSGSAPCLTFAPVSIRGPSPWLASGLPRWSIRDGALSISAGSPQLSNTSSPHVPKYSCAECRQKRASQISESLCDGRSAKEVAHGGLPLTSALPWLTAQYWDRSRPRPCCSCS